jgi:hypothetical protein
MLTNGSFERANLITLRVGSGDKQKEFVVNGSLLMCSEFFRRAMQCKFSQCALGCTAL